ncbi:hypothetical protein O7543_21140 [Solwaraspora sp. WMMA2080]|uniref:hypothetical protein n=1 Tax=unclassified Solwaraspora TaxID=2627926 RepID=UPI00248BD9CB|nr:MULTISPECIES: hypothetical protein [unclassified Solwaraspora]WBB96744.1 hypothetical protein O7553_26230 [Solwaraspora sp. WMMA2059]WBC19352.1 hypothetical protein O7543_21140 [Solwaraspora sp. WMMA2080]
MPDDDSRRGGAEPVPPRTTPVPPAVRTTPAPAPASSGPPADQPAVLELGGDATPPVDGPDPGSGSGPGRWTAVTDRLSGATAATVDRARTVAGTRLGPAGRGNLPSLLLAAVGVLAAAGSLSGEWLDFEIPGIDAGNGGSYADTVLLAELGTYGTGYLLGLLALLVCTALTLFGSHRIRPDVRIAGLTTGAGLLALLVTVMLTGDQLIRSALRVPAEVEVQVAVGTAVTVGLIGVGALLLALYLAGRTTTGRGGTGGGGAVADGGADPGPEPGGGAPADLTVGPTAPFVRPDNPPHQTPRW